MGLGATLLLFIESSPLHCSPISVSHGQVNIYLLSQYFIRQKLCHCPYVDIGRRRDAECLLAL